MPGHNRAAWNKDTNHAPQGGMIVVVNQGDFSLYSYRFTFSRKYS
jgi:hypothetical protein